MSSRGYKRFNGKSRSIREYIKEINNAISGDKIDGEDISLKELSRGEYDTINTNNPPSNRPDGNTPHSIDEFKSYNHDAGES